MAVDKGAFHVQVKEDFDGLNLAQYLARMNDKMHRGALRKMVGRSGTILAAEVRKQIKRRDMPYSRARNAAERKKAKSAGQVPLARSIKNRAWSRPQRGLIGTVVGAEWKVAKHGHLVEFGHRITGRARLKIRTLSWRSLLRGRIRRKTYKIGRRGVSRSGERTIAHGFQQEAMDRTQSTIYREMAKTLSAFMKQQTAKMLRGVPWR